MASEFAVEALPESFVFHHIGYATRSVAKESAWFELLSYRAEGDAFVDPVQGVAGRFFAGAGPRIELLENTPESNVLTPWLDAGIRMYHLAFEVGDLKAAIEWAKVQRARVTVAPVPAVAFEGRRIAFVMMRNSLLLEFIECGTSMQYPKGGR